MSRAHSYATAGTIIILFGTPMAMADQHASGGVHLPGVEITDEGVKLPGVTVDEHGVRIPGVIIDGGGVKMPGVTIGTDEQDAGTMSGKRFVASDLRGHDFSGQDLSGAVFSASDLRGANFSNVNLENAVFSGCDLRGANLRGANLKGAKFKGADLRTSTLSKACLVNAKIVGSDLGDANLSGAVLVGAKMVGNDMAGAITSGAVFDGPANCQTQVAAARPLVTPARDIKQALSTDAGKVDLTVNFETDSDKIQSEGHVQILEIANALKSPELADLRIRIEGHTDNTGTDNYNMDLSYRRAITVMRALSENYGISSGRFEVKGFGELQPLASNGTETGRGLNRRVTLVNLGS